MSDFPYADRFPVNRRLPEHGRSRDEVLEELSVMAREEDAFWETGKVSGTMYCGDHDHYEFLTEAFGKFAHVNALQRDLCPSATRFEGEVVAMVLDLMHGDAVTDGEPGGMLTSGGTGSILHAVLAYREDARARGVTRPNLVKPETAHPAFDKACHLFGVECRTVPVDPQTTRVRPEAMAEAVDAETIALVGSAGNYPYGTIDPIAELGELALRHGIGLHVDGCLGGFILPFGEQLGYDIPAFDFRVPGVTTISADTHKYGYGLKGSSVLLYRSRELRKHQYFTYPGWPGGLYLSPGLAGSRSGGIIASTYAALLATGESGYLAAADGIMRTATAIKEGIRERIPQLEVIGDPTFVIAFKAPEGSDLDIYLVNDSLKPGVLQRYQSDIPSVLIGESLANNMGLQQGMGLLQQGVYAPGAEGMKHRAALNQVIHYPGIRLIAKGVVDCSVDKAGGPPTDDGGQRKTVPIGVFECLLLVVVTVSDTAKIGLKCPVMNGRTVRTAIFAPRLSKTTTTIANCRASPLVRSATRRTPPSSSRRT